jgi:hypothetical protein
MPEAKKITELPVLSSVQAADILPIVPNGGGQTSQCTAAQVAAVGGGPPGANTVSTDKLQNGAVTVTKLGFSGPDLLCTRAAVGAGPGDTEFACTPWARGLLSKQNAAEGFTYVGATPTFSGPVTVPRGEPSAPTYRFENSLQTGFFCIDNSVAVSCGGQYKYLFSEVGNIYSVPAGGTELLPALPVRCFAVFTTATGAQTFTLNRARSVGELLGYTDFVVNGDLSGPCIYNRSTAPTAAQSLAAALSARGLTYVSHGSQQSDGRSNYTSPGDNDLITLDANGQFAGYIAANTANATWVGNLTYSTSAGTSTLLRQENVSSITPSGTQEYTLNFWTAMPDTNYAVLGAAQTTQPTYMRVLLKTTTSCRVQFTGTLSTNPAAPDILHVAIVR